MRLSSLTPLLTLAVVGAHHCVAAPAHAGELDLSVGADASASEWDGDQLGSTLLDVAWQFKPWLQVGLMSRIGYGSIDDRLLEYFSVGAEVHRDLGRVRPYLRGGLVHQHEEPLVGVDNQPFQSVLGVGDGIRHRGGLDLALGVEVPFRSFQAGDFYAAAQVLGTWFPDPRGPGWYMSAGLSVGMRYDFDEAHRAR
jgi:hypothetical protein